MLRICNICLLPYHKAFLKAIFSNKMFTTKVVFGREFLQKNVAE